jgi:hypothetical protein
VAVLWRKGTRVVEAKVCGDVRRRRRRWPRVPRWRRWRLVTAAGHRGLGLGGGGTWVCGIDFIRQRRTRGTRHQLDLGGGGLARRASTSLCTGIDM